MNTPNIILAAKANSGKSTNNVWVVYTSADTANKMYCTSAYKAMRLAFLLKKRLGIGISENSFAIAAALGIAQASLKKEVLFDVGRIFRVWQSWNGVLRMPWHVVRMKFSYLPPHPKKLTVFMQKQICKLFYLQDVNLRETNVV